METLKIKPGSILLWKEYSRITKLFSKSFHIDLSYNKFHYITDHTTLCFPITKGKIDYDELVILELRDLNSNYMYGVLNYILNSKSDYDLDFICLLDGITTDKLIKNFTKRGIEVIIYGTIKLKKDVKYIIDDNKLQKS